MLFKIVEHKRLFWCFQDFSDRQTLARLFPLGLGQHGWMKAERRISGKSFPSRHGSGSNCLYLAISS
jgi:hypothetical protein